MEFSVSLPSPRSGFPSSSAKVIVSASCVVLPFEHTGTKLPAKVSQEVWQHMQYSVYDALRLVCDMEKLESR